MVKYKSCSRSFALRAQAGSAPFSQPCAAAKFVTLTLPSTSPYLARAPFMDKLIAFELLSYLSSASSRTDSADPVHPLQYTGPVRQQSLHPDDEQAMAPWLAAGYDQDLVRQALPVLYDSLMHPNLAWGLRMPGQERYK